jgi:hypothetical protein
MQYSLSALFTPCGEDPHGRCNLLRRATSLAGMLAGYPARYAYLSHASRGIPGNEQAARACFRYLEKSYRYWGLRGRSCSLVASPGGVVPCSCASFVSHPPSLGVLALGRLSMCVMLINTDLEATPLRLTFTV